MRFIVIGMFTCFAWLLLIGLYHLGAGDAETAMDAFQIALALMVFTGIIFHYLPKDDVDH